MATAQSDTSPKFPLPRSGCPFDPPQQYEAMRESGGPQQVRLWNGDPCWIFTSFADVRAVLSDNRFSTVPTKPGFPMLSAARSAVLTVPPTFIRMDPPEHGALRRMFTKEFMIKRIDAMRPRILALVEGLYADLEKRGRTELVQEFALPLTSTVISEFLGVPAEDREFFQEQSRLKVLMDVDPEIPREASAKLIAYFDELLKRKEADPHANDDVLSRLVLDQVEPGHLSHDDAVRHADLLTMAGHETTANQIALGMLSFIQFPEQKEKLLTADAELMKSAVDEMLRYHSIVQFNAPRVALEDVEVNGHLVKKGEGLFALIAAANRDPAVFECPNDFDITRAPDNHLAFSYGVHQCLGQPLARAELQTVFGTIFQRFPGLRLEVPFEEIVFKGDHFVYGLEALPLTW
ncbi:MAG: cytochrome P450 [Pseudomonadota bacterium]